MAEAVIKEVDFSSKERESILAEKSAIDLDLDKTYNRILASILEKDESEISDNDFVGDKLEFLQYQAKDEQTLNNIKSAKSNYDNEKKKITDNITKLLKFKVKLYKSNEEILAELEKSLVNDKKKQTRLNETIISNEQVIADLEGTISDTSASLEESNASQKGKEQKLLEDIEAWTNVLNETLENADPGSVADGSNEEVNHLNEIINSSKKEYDSIRSAFLNDPKRKSLENTLAKCSSDLSDTKLAQEKSKSELENLKIDDKKSKIDTLKEKDLALYNSFEEDVLAYKNAGMEIDSNAIFNSERRKRKAS